MNDITDTYFYVLKNDAFARVLVKNAYETNKSIDLVDSLFPDIFFIEQYLSEQNVSLDDRELLSNILVNFYKSLIYTASDYSSIGYDDLFIDHRTLNAWMGVEFINHGKDEILTKIFNKIHESTYRTLIEGYYKRRSVNQLVMTI